MQVVSGGVDVNATLRSRRHVLFRTVILSALGRRSEIGHTDESLGVTACPCAPAIVYSSSFVEHDMLMNSRQQDSFLHAERIETASV